MQLFEIDIIWLTTARLFHPFPTLSVLLRFKGTFKAIYTEKRSRNKELRSHLEIEVLGICQLTSQLCQSQLGLSTRLCS